MSEELMPCPFCAAIPEEIDGTRFWLECSCGINTSIHESRESVLSFWNTRTPARLESLKQLQQETERLGLYGLSEKQRERRDFVKACLLEKFSYHNSDYHSDTVICALGAFEEYDNQLTQIEEKERGSDV
jgi:hypothetical protein